jgi:predicted peroxiredoxin
MTAIARLLVLAAAIAVLPGCVAIHHTSTSEAAADFGKPILLLNVTSGTEDAHSVTMALQLAGHALDDGRHLVLFFNVRGVEIPTRELSDSLAFKDRPIKELLSDLIDRGAEVHVCPHCMAALGVEADDLVKGAVVTDREKLFSRVGPNTSVFTY